MSTHAPAVTVIMPVRNGARFIRQALESLHAQTFTDFAVLVVDDGSTDGTSGIVAGFGDGRVHLLQNGGDRGPAAARNRALDRAESKYVAFLDSDDIAEPQRLERQIEWLRSHPGAGLVAAQAALIDAGGQPTGAVWGFADADERIAPAMFFRNRLPTSTIVVERAVIGDLRFDETLTVASDYDMWVRVIDRVSPSIHPDALVRYRMHADNITRRRSDASEQCLATIACRRLALLGISPTPSELALHRRIADGRLDATPEFLHEASMWLARLEAANRAARAYAEAPFADVIAGEWLAVCEAAARAGCWAAWPAMARTPLTRRLLTARAGRRGLAPLPWRTVRGYLRRRWPGLGATVRHSISRV